MKAKTINSLPHGWDTCIYDNEDYPTSFYYLNLPSKERADEFTNSFNSALSAHVSQETAPLLAEIDRLKKERHDWACNILKVRDALAENDQNEAYHWLYQIASPNFDKDSDEVWQELEALALLPQPK